MIAEHPTKKWSIEEFHRLGETEPWAKHCELIEGDLIRKMPEGNLHVYLVNILIQWLRQTFGYEYVRQEDPLRYQDDRNEESEPQPDATVLKFHLSAYLDENPGGDDVLFVAEVSESTLQDDLVRNAALYARADFPEYWVLDISGRQIYVHREPREGRYTSLEIYGQEQTVSLLSKPEIHVEVKTLFPPETELV